MKTRLLFALAVGIGSLATLSGCSQGENNVEQEKAKPTPKFVSAEVTITGDASKDLQLVKTFNDEVKVAKLAGYFPGVGQGKKSDIAGSWDSDVEIIFKKKDGEKVKVNTNYNSWSEGQGDWKVESGLKQFLKKLFE